MTPLLAGSGFTMLLVVVAFFLLMTFLAQRPMKKQAQQQAEMRNGITEGVRVLLAGGLFGTVTHVGDEQLIVELAPGVEVTVLKSAVQRTVTADDEEFEFSDGSADEPVVDEPTWQSPAVPADGATTGQVVPGTDRPTH